MVADLEMMEQEAQIERMKDLHPATLVYIKTLVRNLRRLLDESGAFNPHETDSILEVIENELVTYGELNRRRVAEQLHGKQMSRAKAANIAEAIVR